MRHSISSSKRSSPATNVGASGRTKPPDDDLGPFGDVPAPSLNLNRSRERIAALWRQVLESRAAIDASKIRLAEGRETLEWWAKHRRD